MKVLAGAGLLLVSAVLGVAVAVASVALHQLWWGLLLGCAASLAAVVALPARWSARPPYAVAYAAVLAAALRQRPEGDFLVPAGAAGYLLLGVAVTLLVVAVATLPRAQRR